MSDNSTLEDIRNRARTLHGDGYHHAQGAPTGAACDVQWLLGYIDNQEQSVKEASTPGAPQNGLGEPRPSAP